MDKEKEKKRNVLLPGESGVDFDKAMANSNMTEKEFRAARLLLNGWTEDDERTFLMHLSTVGKYAQLAPSYT